MEKEIHKKREILRGTYLMEEEEFHRLTTKEIANLITGDVPIEYILWAQKDHRKSVQNIGATYLYKQQKVLLEQQRVAALYEYENSFYVEGKQYVAGVDEVGRGPIAGPVTVAAVILPPNLYIEGINDSKKLSHHKREVLYDKIMENALAVSVISYDPMVIDRINIYEATKAAMYEAIKTLSIEPDAVLIDAMKLPNLDIPTVSLIKGDSKSASIAAASIIAKVTRDRYMDELETLYPGYGFSCHKGYCTEQHKEALFTLGITPAHRRSFEPVSSLVQSISSSQLSAKKAKK